MLGGVTLVRKTKRTRAPLHWAHVVVAVSTLSLAALLVPIVATSTPADAADHTVDTASDDPLAGDTLREAIDAANGTAGLETIQFASGVTGSTIALTAPLVVRDSLDIVGPGVNELTLTNSTGSVFVIADGASLRIEGLTIDAAADDAITTDDTIGPGGANLIIDGVTITNGAADAIDANLGGSLTVTSSTIDANAGAAVRSTGVAGSISFTQSAASSNDVGIAVSDVVFDVAIATSTISSNTSGNVVLDGVEGTISVTSSTLADSATGPGLAVSSSDDDLNLTGVFATGNHQANAIVDGLGGSVVVSDSTFSGSVTSGGLTATSIGDTILTRVTTADNTGVGTSLTDVFGVTLMSELVSTGNAVGLDADNAGVFVLLADSTIADSSSVGADIAGGFGDNQIERSTFSGNADRALRVTNGSSIVNSTFTANGTNNTPVIDAGPATVVVEHTTVVDNGMAAGAAATFAGTDIAIDHSIVTRNGGPLGTPVSVTHSATPIGSALGVTNIEADDPGLNPLAANGGPTMTMTSTSTSPVIDAGDSTAIGPIATDQRGQARVVGVDIDMGAVEFDVTDIPPPTTTTTTTIAPSTSTTSPSTSVAPTTTIAPATTVAPTSTVAPSTTAVSTTSLPDDGPTPTITSTTNPTNTTTTTQVPATTTPPPAATVPDPNSPPTIQPILARTISASMQTLVPVSVRDIDGDELVVRAESANTAIVAIEKVSRPTMSNVLDERRYDLTVRGLTAGSTSITITVSDGTSVRTAQVAVIVVETQLPATGDSLARDTGLIASALLGLGIGVRALARRRRFF